MPRPQRIANIEPTIRPSDVPNVAPQTAITSSWGNTVADGINGMVDDLYGSSQLEIPWTAITGVPPTMPTGLGPVIPTQAYGLEPVDGVGPAASAADHSHGSPPLPTAAQIGTVVSVTTPGTIAGGRRIFVGTTAPADPVEGDIWIKA